LPEPTAARATLRRSKKQQAMGRSAAELLREQKRTLNSSIREMERERRALERQERQLVLDIKKMAKTSQMVQLLLFKFIFPF